MSSHKINRSLGNASEDTFRSVIFRFGGSWEISIWVWGKKQYEQNEKKVRLIPFKQGSFTCNGNDTDQLKINTNSSFGQRTKE